MIYQQKKVEIKDTKKEVTYKSRIIDKYTIKVKATKPTKDKTMKRLQN